MSGRGSRSKWVIKHRHPPGGPLPIFGRRSKGDNYLVISDEQHNAGRHVIVGGHKVFVSHNEEDEDEVEHVVPGIGPTWWTLDTVRRLEETTAALAETTQVGALGGAVGAIFGGVLFDAREEARRPVHGLEEVIRRRMIEAAADPPPTVMVSDEKSEDAETEHFFQLAAKTMEETRAVHARIEEKLERFTQMLKERAGG